MTDRPAPQHESRLFVDGKLVDGEAGTFDVVNPATEKVIGAVADASVADVRQAIAAARRAFDETTWSTDRAFRKRVPAAAAGGARGRAGGAPRGAHRARSGARGWSPTGRSSTSRSPTGSATRSG